MREYDRYARTWPPLQSQTDVYIKIVCRLMERHGLLDSYSSAFECYFCFLEGLIYLDS